MMSDLMKQAMAQMERETGQPVKTQNFYDVATMRPSEWLEAVWKSVCELPAGDSHVIEVPPLGEHEEATIMRITPANRREWIRDTRRLIAALKRDGL